MGNILDAYAVKAEIVRGADVVLSMDIQDEDGNAFDLTGYDVVLRIGELYGDAALLEIQGVVTSAPDGYVDFTFVPEDTSWLVAKSYDSVVYAISLTDTYPAFRGRIAIVSGMSEVVEEV